MAGEKPRRARWRWLLFSTDHKAVGLAYGCAACCFLLLGFALVLVLRWQLAWPGRPLPLGELIFGPEAMPGGVMVPELYNALGAMHGTIMVFLAIVPLAVGGFGTYLLPLMIGARSLAFPRLSRLGFWLFVAGGLTMSFSFLLPGGAAQAGWTAYPPLAHDGPTGQLLWLLAMVLIMGSVQLGAINSIVTVVQLRAEGMGFLQLPFFVWSQVVSAVLLLMAFPPLGAAALMQIMDRVMGSSFFLPQGLMAGGQPLDIVGGGSPLLWQHLFWFLAHPEVYVLALPALGIVAEVLTCHARRRAWGYRGMAGSALLVGLLSFLVWAHHMFLTEMSTGMSAFFQTTTMLISMPTVVLLTSLVLTLWGGSIRFTPAMLFALAFLPLFGLGGLTGLPLGLAASDIHLHDTYYVVGHFHLLVAPGTLFALFAGVYHWYPKLTGRVLGSRLAHLHFWPSLICMGGIFVPMLVQGLGGMPRRLYDGGRTYAHTQELAGWHLPITLFAMLLAVAQLPFLCNLVLSLRRPRAAENPWAASTLEWLTDSPPPAHNFKGPVRVLRGPYGYGLPEGGLAKDGLAASHEPGDAQPMESGSVRDYQAQGIVG